MARSDVDDRGALVEDPLWYKDAIIYEIPIRAYYDSNGDGFGDFEGLIQKLDYVADLGVSAIWLLPFYPSPQKDGGYDIADYRSVADGYGSLADFKRLMSEAHARGIRVITELVINHTSDQHPWFQRARRAAAGTRHRDYYVWTDDPAKYRDARIIFQDFETSNWTWDALAGAYFWHRFYGHQPDLNFDSPDVQREVLELVDFWFDLGVDGLRLDAIPYLYERDETNCENLPETHTFLKKIRAHVDARYPNRMLLAEANQWPEDAAAYFGRGDECHMNFHFPLMPRMFMSLQLENSSPILDILAQTPRIPDNAQWAVFLRNHDELTLEMVTDEDRDFMYRVYAHDPQMRVNLGIRRRLGPLLKTRARIELMTALLFAMPGTPVLYYGDEFGMGDNVYLGDRDGVRTPMQWSSDRNAGFSRANPQKMFLPVIIDPEFHYETVNVEAQQNNSDSLLWWTKRLIALRKKHRAFGRGEIELLHPDNGKVLAFFRTEGEERLLVVANLAGSPQYVQLDLSAYAGLVPLELLGLNHFPPIGELPYLLTLSPYGFYWFAIENPRADGRQDYQVAQLSVKGSLAALFSLKSKDRLGPVLGEWVRHRRWFRGKARKVKSFTISDLISVNQAHLILMDIDYLEGDPETYLLTIAIAPPDRVAQIEKESPRSIIATIRAAGEEHTLVDAFATEHHASDLLALLLEREVVKGEVGLIRAKATDALPKLVDGALTARAGRARRSEELPPRVGGAEQSNTNVLFGDKMILKLFRGVEPGEHPEEEVGLFLTERARFGHVPRLLGTLSYERPSKGAQALAVLQELVPNQGDAWQLTLDALGRYFEQAWQSVELGPLPQDTRTIVERATGTPPERVRDGIGAYLGLARLLGERTGQLHLALASETEDPDFTPEPFSLLYQRALYQSVRSLLGQTATLLKKNRKSMKPEVAELVERLLARREQLDARLAAFHREKLKATRTRIHGDLHLGQVLYVAGDFFFIDFEGEPARSLAERRRRRTPLRDAAGMIRSFHYAAAAVLRSDRVRSQDEAVLAPWAHAWTDWVSAAWFDAWHRTIAPAKLLPEDRGKLARMMDFYLLEKGVYEVYYELNNRPDWLEIPVRGLLDLLELEAP